MIRPTPTGCWESPGPVKPGLTCVTSTPIRPLPPRMPVWGRLWVLWESQRSCRGFSRYPGSSSMERSTSSTLIIRRASDGCGHFTGMHLSYCGAMPGSCSWARTFAGGRRMFGAQQQLPGKEAPRDSGCGCALRGRQTAVGTGSLLLGEAEGRYRCGHGRRDAENGRLWAAALLDESSPLGRP